MNLKVTEIAKALGTNLDSDNIIDNVSIDSRNVSETTLFFAIKGDRFDGHDFVKDVAEKGVGAVVCHKKVDCNAPVIYVEDTKKAFLQFANHYRNSIEGLRVIGLTGSVGKTSTKDFVYTALSPFAQTVRSLGNHNNEIGMPQTIFGFAKDDKFAILEMGMDHIME